MLTHNENLWIGMNDVNWEMHFVWTDGKGISYTNWAKGHPTRVPDGRYGPFDEVISTLNFNRFCLSEVSGHYIVM